MNTKAVTTETFEAARHGDRNAIVRLLERTQPDIRRYARATCRTADVDDATQETLWLLSRHVGAIRALATLSKWLFSVVRRDSLRLARRTGMIAAVDEDAL